MITCCCFNTNLDAVISRHHGILAPLPGPLDKIVKNHQEIDKVKNQHFIIFWEKLILNQLEAIDRRVSNFCWQPF